MCRKSFPLIFAAAFLFPAALLCELSVSQAAVFERDWKTSGDGLLTYDDDNQREWLDLALSNLGPYDPNPSVYRLTDLDNAVAAFLHELEPGGQFEGFQFANRAKVLGLLESAGINITPTGLEDNIANALPMRNLLRLLDDRELNDTDGHTGIGVIDETGPGFPLPVPAGGVPMHRAAFLQVYEPDSLLPLGKADYFFSNNNDVYVPSWVGVMLFRDIPEPSTIICLLVALPLVASRPRYC